MRAIWKGSISFGLVNIPVRLYAATEDHDIAFHQVHAADAGRIRYKKVCEACQEEISAAEIAKSYEAPDGRAVVLSDDDLASLPAAVSKAVEVTTFVDVEQIDLRAHAKCYYLEPDRGAARAYALLRDALGDSGKVGVARLSLRTRERLAVLRSANGVILLQTLLWPDEVRSSNTIAVDRDVKFSSAESKLARSLITTMTGDLRSADLTDTHGDAVSSLVERKLAGVPLPSIASAAPKSAEVIDLMSALKLSVERAAEHRQSLATAKNAAAAPDTARKRSAERSGAQSDRRRPKSA